MKILMITSYFAPDTAMAAVRPYMFAKYLALKGHDVTVLRSGEILASIDDDFNCEQFGVKVVSYLGEESIIEKYKKGILNKAEIKKNKSRISFIPVKYRKKIADVYHRIFLVYEYKKEENKAKYYSDIISKYLNNSMNDLKFDIVFSTYGRLDNVFAGKYAKDYYNAKWILDLRDRIAHDIDPIAHYIQRKTEIEYISEADAVTVVTQAYKDDLNKILSDAFVEVIYNGYETCDESIINENLDGKLVFCYTGSMYTGKLDVSPLFEAISFLKKNEKIDTSNIEFNYAGAEYDYLYAQAVKFDVQEVLINKGYLNKKQIIGLQKSSDIYVVAARNIEHYYDEIPGKFYEGIRAHKPILVVVSGNVKNGELYRKQLDYNYGYCYETSGGNSSFSNLCKFIESAYIKRMSGERVDYNPSSNLFTDFRYDILSDKIDNLIKKISD